LQSQSGSAWCRTATRTSGSARTWSSQSVGGCALCSTSAEPLPSLHVTAWPRLAQILHTAQCSTLPLSSKLYPVWCRVGHERQESPSDLSVAVCCV
jgi:hypothetical protein